MIEFNFQKIKNFFLENKFFLLIKDKLIFSAWILGIILISGITWHLTVSVRTNFLRIAVNQVFEQYGGNLRLGDQKNGVNYFSLTDHMGFSDLGTVYIFSFFTDGLSFPCAAIIGRDGRIQNFIALNPQGQKYLMDASVGLIAMYTRRIEGSSYE